MRAARKRYVVRLYAADGAFIAEHSMSVQRAEDAARRAAEKHPEAKLAKCMLNGESRGARRIGL